jgi:hypothetical protein
METRIVQPMGQLTPDLPYSGSACFGYVTHFVGLLKAFDYSHSNREQ